VVLWGTTICFMVAATIVTILRHHIDEFHLLGGNQPVIAPPLTQPPENAFTADQEQDSPRQQQGPGNEKLRSTCVYLCRQTPVTVEVLLYPEGGTRYFLTTMGPPPAQPWGLSGLGLGLGLGLGPGSASLTTAFVLVLSECDALMVCRGCGIQQLDGAEGHKEVELG
jgi:hypothetical protein